MTVRVGALGPRARSRAAGGALSGLLLAIAHLPGPALAPLLVFVALVPLWRTLDRVGSPRVGAEVGAWFGGVFWAIQLAWVPLVAPRIGAFWPWMAWAGQVTLLTLLSAGMGAGFLLLRGSRIPPVAAAVAAWVGVEWARGHLLGPFSFPWSGIALPLARLPVLAQPAAWGGETLLAAGVVSVNAALALPRTPEGDRPGGVGRSRLVALALVALWAALGYGRMRLLGDRMEARARAVVVQPAVSLEEKRGAGAEAAALASLRYGLIQAEEHVRGEGVGLVVFPETHLPLAVTFGSEVADGSGEVGERRGDAPAPWPGALTSELRAWAGAHGVGVLVGAYRVDEDGLRNSLLHFGGDGAEGFYDKVALVPGVEWGPGALVPGTDVRPLAVEGGAGVLICIESAWASLARRQARAGAGWFLNVTNDAWLGEGPQGRVGTTPAFHQHPWHLVLRSVETGRGAVRVANNGWTGSVDPLGRWQAALPPHRPGVAVVSALGLADDTLFVRAGDLLGPLSLLILALTPLVSRREGPR